MSSVSTSKSRPSVNRSSTAGGYRNSEVSANTDKPPRSAGPHPKRKKNKTSSDQLKAKEEEYMRINAELEAKTSELVREAEELLKGDLSGLMEDDSSHRLSPGTHNVIHSPLHAKHSPHKLLSNYLEDDNLFTSSPDHEWQLQPTPQQRPSTTANMTVKTQSSISNRPHSSAQERLHSKPTSLAQERLHSKPISSTKSKVAQRHPQSKLKSKPTTVASTKIPQVDSISSEIDSTVERLERGLDSLGRSTGGEDILPEMAEDMGPEATIRFLKAKLRVMQEEMDRLCQGNREKEKSLTQAETKLKEVSEQAAKIQRNHQSMSSQVDKYRQLSETLKHKCEGLETQLVSLRKEMDGMKGFQKKAVSQQSTVEVRLNRALEETEKYKAALQKARADMKDSSKQDRQKLEHLSTENKQLVRQKTELVAAFKKQMKLVDILKRQKMHLEAAKMLSFSEEEFVKALDWGSS